jgi:hypothetical protein
MYSRGGAGTISGEKTKYALAKIGHRELSQKIKKSKLRMLNRLQTVARISQLISSPSRRPGFALNTLNSVRHPFGFVASMSSDARETASKIALCNSESPEGGYLATRTLAMPKDENMHR